MDQGRGLRSLAGGVMTCKPCEERRKKLVSALSKRDAIKAARQMMLGAAELVGLKKKEGDKD